ncbi:2-phosphosulfolactate phosphatase [Peribacillus deserti]|uniref:Probable 2-phosphosulfolactate phosphatase n=1 Tax=Peribacillus deserti TaxID=673318 RepID=A0ABS2QF51_9BACI|nr:2-phosphosulfolactate phosphatase [Peribacillus deserti]MBM7691324.1 2-phosphosulfolactate phosphatase [Peribacillus deserti]
MKIHLLATKEEIHEAKIAAGKKVAVVFDVLLATTTITSALEDGAIEVITAETPEAALLMSSAYRKDFVIAGELCAKPIDGFLYPSPVILKEAVKGRALFLSTTNGTVALKKASSARRVYLSCLLNNPSVAGAVRNDYTNDSVILVICSGNSGSLSLEDFYGAGHFIDCLTGSSAKDHELTDAAKAALFFYRGNVGRSMEILSEAKVGQMLLKYGMLDELELAASIGTSLVVPLFSGGKVTKQETAETILQGGLHVGTDKNHL